MWNRLRECFGAFLLVFLCACLWITQSRAQDVVSVDAPSVVTVTQPTADAPPAAPGKTDLVDSVQTLKKAAEQRNWFLALGAFISFLAFGLRMFLRLKWNDEQLKPWLLPLVLLLSLMSTLGPAMVKGGVDGLVNVLPDALETLFTAVGVWEAALKRIVPKAVSVATPNGAEPPKPV